MLRARLFDARLRLDLGLISALILRLLLGEALSRLALVLARLAVTAATIAASP